MRLLNCNTLNSALQGYSGLKLCTNLLIFMQLDRLSN